MHEFVVPQTLTILLLNDLDYIARIDLCNEKVAAVGFEKEVRVARSEKEKRAKLKMFKVTFRPL